MSTEKLFPGNSLFSTEELNFINFNCIDNSQIKNLNTSNEMALEVCEKTAFTVKYQ